MFIIDDALVETDQSFTVEIINTPLVVVPGEQVTTVIIIDNDGMYLTELLMLNSMTIHPQQWAEPHNLYSQSSRHVYINH